MAEDGRHDPEKVGVDGIKGTAPVGAFKMNVLGFYDFGGNALEWMWDWQAQKAFKWDWQVQKAHKTIMRDIRGGGWNNDAWFCAVAARNNIHPDDRNGTNIVGFRVALGSVP